MRLDVLPDDVRVRVETDEVPRKQPAFFLQPGNVAGLENRARRGGERGPCRDLFTRDHLRQIPPGSAGRLLHAVRLGETVELERSQLTCGDRQNLCEAGGFRHAQRRLERGQRHANSAAGRAFPGAPDLTEQVAKRDDVRPADGDGLAREQAIARGRHQAPHDVVHVNGLNTDPAAARHDCDGQERELFERAEDRRAGTKDDRRPDDQKGNTRRPHALFRRALGDGVVVPARIRKCRGDGTDEEELCDPGSFRGGEQPRRALRVRAQVIGRGGAPRRGRQMQHRAALRQRGRIGGRFEEVPGDLLHAGDCRVAGPTGALECVDGPAQRGQRFQKPAADKSAAAGDEEAINHRTTILPRSRTSAAVSLR